MSLEEDSDLNFYKMILVNAPMTQLDDVAREMIKKWSEPPKAIEVLEVLDKCIFTSLASDFVVTLLQIVYELACKNENTSHDILVQSAVWRNEK